MKTALWQSSEANPCYATDFVFTQQLFPDQSGVGQLADHPEQDGKADVRNTIEQTGTAVSEPDV